MRWVVTGANGQLGTALSQLSSEEAGVEIIPLSHRDLDITATEDVFVALKNIRPEGVINTAAYNLVDLAEEQREQALLLNSTGPECLARVCESWGIPLVQVSSDYVFGGERDRTIPYREEDVPAPLGEYARSKLAGEERVRALCSRSFIVRTCGVYGRARSAGKGNFVETMLRLAGERPELRVVHDQRCTPTPAHELARGICRLIQTEAYGTYHLTCQGDCSWYEFAVEILRQAELNTPVIPISTTEFGAKAERPGYSVLNCDRLERIAGFRALPWNAGLAAYLNQRNQPTG